MNLREGPVLCRAFGEGECEEGGCALTLTSLGCFLALPVCPAAFQSLQLLLVGLFLALKH